MKKLLLFGLIALASCQKADIKPIEKDRVPAPITQIVWFDHWNMDLIEMRYFDIEQHIGKLKGNYPQIDVVIVSDNGQEYNLNDGGGYWWNDNKLWMHRTDWYDNGIFDNEQFNDGYMNRGYVIIYQ